MIETNLPTFGGPGGQAAPRGLQLQPFLGGADGEFSKLAKIIRAVSRDRRIRERVYVTSTCSFMANVENGSHTSLSFAEQKKIIKKTKKKLSLTPRCGAE